MLADCVEASQIIGRRVLQSVASPTVQELCTIVGVPVVGRAGFPIASPGSPGLLLVFRGLLVGSSPPVGATAEVPESEIAVMRASSPQS